jgi:hypothetical protein
MDLRLGLFGGILYSVLLLRYPLQSLRFSSDGITGRLFEPFLTRSFKLLDI